MAVKAEAGKPPALGRARGQPQAGAKAGPQGLAAKGSTVPLSAENGKCEAHYETAVTRAEKFGRMF